MMFIRKSDNQSLLKSVVIFIIQQASFVYTLATQEVVSKDQWDKFFEISTVFDDTKWKWDKFDSTEEKTIQF